MFELPHAHSDGHNDDLNVAYYHDATLPKYTKE